MSRREIAKTLDLDHELKPLKDFQKKTVAHVVRHLYDEPSGTRRFLVADEVGLGKTMIARGVIAKAIEHLRDKVKRIDVIYVCSNAAIAQQNLERLDVLDAGFRPFATRLTLIARQIRDIAKRPVNFVSFTPGTTFDLKSRAGRSDERALLYQILTTEGLAEPTPARNLLRANVSPDRWKWMLSDLPDDIDVSIRTHFAEGLKADRPLRQRLNDALDRFKRHRDELPDADGALQYEVIGALRQLLARVLRACAGARPHRDPRRVPAIQGSAGWRERGGRARPHALRVPRRARPAPLRNSLPHGHHGAREGGEPPPRLPRHGALPRRWRRGNRVLPGERPRRVPLGPRRHPCSGRRRAGGATPGHRGAPPSADVPHRTRGQHGLAGLDDA
jgi:hypothetical protein